MLVLVAVIMDVSDSGAWCICWSLSACRGKYGCGTSVFTIVVAFVSIPTMRSIVILGTTELSSNKVVVVTYSVDLIWTPEHFGSPSTPGRGGAQVTMNFGLSHVGRGGSCIPADHTEKTGHLRICSSYCWGIFLHATHGLLLWVNPDRIPDDSSIVGASCFLS